MKVRDLILALQPYENLTTPDLVLDIGRVSGTLYITRVDNEEGEDYKQFQDGHTEGKK